MRADALGPSEKRSELARPVTDMQNARREAFRVLAPIRPTAEALPAFGARILEEVQRLLHVVELLEERFRILLAACDAQEIAALYHRARRHRRDRTCAFLHAKTRTRTHEPQRCRESEPPIGARAAGGERTRCRGGSAGRASDYVANSAACTTPRHV